MQTKETVAQNATINYHENLRDFKNHSRQQLLEQLKLNFKVGNSMFDFLVNENLYSDFIEFFRKGGES